MKPATQLDCVVIGYNELPFQRYESFLRNYGQDTEAYRDLKFSFLEIGEEKLDYLGLLNRIFETARKEGSGAKLPAELRSGDIPNLAAVYLTNFLRNKGHQARYVNLFQYEKEKLIRYLEEDPLCVAITTTFYVVNLPVIEMIDFIRKHNKKVKIVVGGPLVANHARNYQGDAFYATLDDIGADIFVIEGQGESTLSEIVACLKDDGDLERVPNIVYRKNGSLRRTSTQHENNSLEEHFVDWRSFSNENLGATIQTRTARSCAFKCAFCNYPTRAGALTTANIDVVEKELDSIVALGNVKNVVFIDDTFNVPLTRFKDLCRMMIRKKYNFNWFSYFRCSNSDEEAIDLMAESGCKGVFLGIESGSPTILKNMNKAATIERYAKGIECLRHNGVLTFGSFIVGFPGETDETVAETIEFLKTSRPDYYRAQLWYCEPGTPIQLQRDKYNIRGDGFVWNHNTMDSLEGMDHIEKMFLTVDESIWLPQWSFDFWVIPYLLGRGISLERFKELMGVAHRMLALEIASVPANEKQAMQRDYIQAMVQASARPI
jgi:radical SAM PhpK family P-methyltransferase